MQLVDKNGNIFGAGIEITGPDGKPKTTSGGGSPTGPAGGDLYGTYPNPGVDWNLGISTYSMYYYPLSSNPAGYIDSSALTPYLTSASAASTYYPLTNPSGYITSAALSGYLTAATAASTYYPNTNPLNFISIVSYSDVTSALGYTPYDSSNPNNYIDSSALAPYLTASDASTTYYPLTNPSSYISGITSGDVTTALGYTPYDSTNPAGYIDSTALSPYLKSATAATIYQPTLVSGTNIKTVNSTSLLGSGDVAVQPTLVSGTNIKTVNGSSLLGSGDLTVSANPRLLGFKGIIGSPAASAVAICHSILIPANTLTTNSILQVIFRMYRQTGNVGQMYGRIYFNTTNSLTGASLFPTIFTMNGGSTQYMGLVERNFAYNGTTLTSYSNTAYSEYTTGTSLTVSLNRAVDNYVLLTMQTQNVSEVANIDLVKVFAYV